MHSTPHQRVSAFWPCLWLGLCLLAIKAPYVQLLEDVPTTWAGTLRALAVLAAADVAFAVASGLLFQTLIYGARSRPQLQRWMWWSYLGFGVLAVVWAILSLRLGQVLRMPLTYPLLYLAGDLKNMSSSLGRSFSPGAIAAFIGLPSFYIGAVLVTRRFVAARRALPLRLAQALVLVGVGGWWLWASAEAQGNWGRQEDSRALANNPHLAFVQSWLTAMAHGGAVDLHEQYPAGYVTDFQVVRERSAPASPGPALARGPRNVIVVVGESIGAEHLSLYGSQFKTWPNMEAEAAHALVFDNFYSHITNTANSLVALTLSIYPPMGWREFTVENPAVAGDTAAQVLRQKGYRTAFISAGNNEFSNQDKFLENRGYDVVEDARQIGGPQLSSWGVDDKAMVKQVFKFVDAAPAAAERKPFYIFAWTQGTHHPYEPGPDWQIQDFVGTNSAWGNEMGWELNRYLNALKESDVALANLFAGLRARGLADDTIVIVTGDHGQAFGRPHKTYFHSGRVYQEDVRVPLVIWNPQLFKSGSRSAQIGAHVDLSPTVLDLLGVAAPGSFQGHSLFDPEHPARAYFYGAMDSYLFGVREGNMKYIYTATSGREEFYDLAADPQEQRNLAAERPGQCRPLRQRLGAWLDYQKRLFPELGR